MHVSDGGGVATSAGGPAEVGRIEVSIERVDQDGLCGSPAVRIEGCDPLTPLQALELAATLQAAAITALLDEIQVVTR